MSEPIRKIVTSKGAVRYRVVVDAGRKPDGRRNQRTATFRTRREAREWLSETRQSLRAGTYVAPARTTVAEHLDTWLAGRRGLRPGTVESYRVALRPARDMLGAMRLQQVTRADVERVVSAMLSGSVRRAGRSGAPLSPRSVNLTVTLLRAALETAVRDGQLARNPAAYVEHVPQARTERRTWTTDDVRRFLEVAGRDRLAAAWRLSLLGLRRGEVLGLTWADVDLGAATLTVRQARTMVAGHGDVLGPPKSARSRRTLPLDAGTVAALGSLRRRQREERLAAGEAYRESGYVVVDELGEPVRGDWFSDRFGRLSREAGVPAIRLHDARHSCLTLLHLAGVPTAVVSAWAGHSSAAFTMGTYMHSQDPALTEAGRVLGDLLGDACESSVTGRAQEDRAAAPG